MAHAAVNALLEELMGESRAEKATPSRGQAVEAPSGDYLPLEPTSLEEAGLSETLVESLILKFLLNCHTATGWRISEQVCLPNSLVMDLLRSLKNDQLIVYRKAAGPNDFEHELTDTGHQRAQRYFEQRTYHGAAPVKLDDYRTSVRAQSLRNEHPNAADLAAAFKGLCVSPVIFSQLGQAICSVGAVFLYGAPGNGKTSMAERLTSAFGRYIWIPRALHIDGEIVRIYDPMVHEVAPTQESESSNTRIDRRWIRIRRPTVVAGGELTLAHLELAPDRSSGAVEAPLHLKSNCGTLLIDDFGRQRVSTTDLLNRWIVPLEKQYDYLTTPAGKKIQVPFDQLIVFATNLEPKQLVDEAFLRRIPYKVEVANPTKEEFTGLFESLSSEYGLEYRPEVIEYLISKHYVAANRSFRFCHVRDLLRQVGNHCRFHAQRIELTPEVVDAVVWNYFGRISPATAAATSL